MQQLRRASQMEDVKVILMYGAGGNFSSGYTVGNMDDPNKDFKPSNTIEGVAEWMTEMTLSYMELDKPLYMLVEGVAVGIMATCVAHADFVYVSPNAMFLTPFVQLGINSEDISSITFPALLGRRKANEMLLLGLPLLAKEAEELGFVNGIIPNEKIPKTDPIITDYTNLPFFSRLVKGDSRT